MGEQEQLKEELCFYLGYTEKDVEITSLAKSGGDPKISKLTSIWLITVNKTTKIIK